MCAFVGVCVLCVCVSDLAHFALYRWGSVQQYRVLHQVLDTWRLNFLQERTARLLPCPEIDLSHVFSHCSAEHTHTVLHTDPSASVYHCVLHSHTHLDRNCSWFLMVSWIILMKPTSQLKRNARKRFPWETERNTHTHTISILYSKQSYNTEMIYHNQANHSILLL